MNKVKVAVLFCDRYEPAALYGTLHQGFDLLGGLRRFVKKGESLLR